MAQALHQAWQRDRNMPVPPYSSEVMHGCAVMGNRDFFKWYVSEHSDSIRIEELKFLFHEGRAAELEIFEEIESHISPLELERTCCLTILATESESYISWLMERGRVPILNTGTITSLILNLVRDTRSGELSIRIILQALTLMEQSTRRECVQLLLAMKDPMITSITCESGLVEPVMLLDLPRESREIVQVYRPPPREEIRLAFDLVKSLKKESGYQKIIQYISAIDGTGAYGLTFLSYLLGASNKSLACPKTSSNDDMLICFLHSGIIEFDPDCSLEIAQIIYLVVYHGSDRLVEELTALFDTYDPDTDDEEEEQSMFHDIYIKSMQRSLHSLAYAAGTANSLESRRILARYILVLQRLGTNVKLNHDYHLDIMAHGDSTEIGKLLLTELNRKLIAGDSVEQLMNLGDRILAKVLEHGSGLTLNVWSVLNANLGLVGDHTLHAIIHANGIFSPTNPIGVKMLSAPLREYISKHKRIFVREVIRKFRDYNHVTLSNLLSIIIPHISFADGRLTLGDRTYTERIKDSLVYLDELPSISCSTCQKIVGDRPRIHPTDSHGVFYCPECSTTGEVPTCKVCMSNDDDLIMKILTCRHVVCTECLKKIKTCAMCRTDITLGMKRTTTTSEAIEHFMSLY